MRTSLGTDLELRFSHLWPALVRAASRFPKKHVAQVLEVHTSSGRHVAKEVAFPKWVPAEVKAEARGLSVEEALRSLGDWCA